MSSSRTIEIKNQHRQPGLNNDIFNLFKYNENWIRHCVLLAPDHLCVIALNESVKCLEYKFGFYYIIDVNIFIWFGICGFLSFIHFHLGISFSLIVIHSGARLFYSLWFIVYSSSLHRFIRAVVSGQHDYHPTLYVCLISLLPSLLNQPFLVCLVRMLMLLSGHSIHSGQTRFIWCFS